MTKFNVGDRVVVTDYPYEDVDTVLAGRTGTVVPSRFGPHSIFVWTVLDEPLEGFGSHDNPILLLESEVVLA